jgi:hypothetical protein
MLNIVESVRMRLKRRVGCFGLYGYDFMIDEQMKVWLIEVNVNPALTTNTHTLLQAIPPVVEEAIGSVTCCCSSRSAFIPFVRLHFAALSIECFDKIRHSQKIFPLKSLRGFKCIYNELERKTSLPHIEQKRAMSSTPASRRTVAGARANAAHSPPHSPSHLARTSDCNTSSCQRAGPGPASRSSVDRPKVNRSSDCLPTTHTSHNETMIMRYQTIQRYRTNVETLKPATVIADEWRNLDRTHKDRLALGGGSKALVVVSKSSPSPSSSKHSPTVTT